MRLRAQVTPDHQTSVATTTVATTGRERPAAPIAPIASSTQTPALGVLDYVHAQGTLTFAPGETTQQIVVGVLGDTTFESDETFVVVLSGASNATISGDPATGTIVNDDAAPTVSIMDLRLDKSFTFGKFGRLTGMMDIFNAFNNGTVTNFATTTGANYLRVIGILDPRIVRFGVRYDF